MGIGHITGQEAVVVLHPQLGALVVGQAFRLQRQRRTVTVLFPEPDPDPELDDPDDDPNNDVLPIMLDNND